MCAYRAGIQTALLQAHPQLLVEAEQLAAGFLSQEDRHAVAEDVADELRALHLSQLADRAGPQWGGGYVDPHDAADEMLDEIVQPSLDDLSRRARIGAVQAAREIGFGVLMGLYACGDEDDNDRGGSGDVAASRHTGPHQCEHPGRETSCAAQRSSTGHWLAHWAVAMS